MQVAVFGAAGFVGRNLVPELVKKGHDVKCFDVVKSKELEKLFVIDITNFSAVEKALKDCEAVIDLAAAPLIASIPNPLTDVQTNILGNVNIFEASKRNRVRVVVFSSASSVYGEGRGAIKEDHPCVPKTPYAVSKLACEHYLRVFNELYGLNYAAFRFYNVYGPFQPPGSGRLIPNLLDNISQGKQIQIFGDGSQIRDFIYVGDVCEYIIRAISSNPSNSVFNLGTGKPARVIDIVHACGRVTGIPPKIEHLPPRSGEISDFWADITKLVSVYGALGFKTLEEGLELTWSWHKTRS